MLSLPGVCLLVFFVTSDGVGLLTSWTTPGLNVVSLAPKRGLSLFYPSENPELMVPAFFAFRPLFGAIKIFCAVFLGAATAA